VGNIENGRRAAWRASTSRTRSGFFYEHLTSALGFKPSRHEGKILGLAAYGDPTILHDAVKARFRVENGNFKYYGANNHFFPRYLSLHFRKKDIAAAYQKVLEEVVTEMVATTSRTGVTNVVLSGGVTANVKLNQRVAEVPGVTGMWVHPAMGDAGTGTGAAMHVLREKLGRSLRPERMHDAYLGPGYSREEVRKALEANNLTWTEPATYGMEVAKLIHAGKVVARFDGRMEYGPRALGNRSVMYHAREPQVNKWLNKQLARTEFMPFAPVTLWEDRHRYYKNIDVSEPAANFMTVTVDCTEEMIRDCPAAVHVDGTARPQLVKREVNRAITTSSRRTSSSRAARARSSTPRSTCTRSPSCARPRTPSAPSASGTSTTSPSGRAWSSQPRPHRAPPRVPPGGQAAPGRRGRRA
jgi:carbamoyltransferase